jgi:hypothetical protein
MRVFFLATAMFASVLVSNSVTAEADQLARPDRT